ncbi:MAG: SRPBCC domain-containing protein [Thermoplasmata archaeon]
MNPTETTEVRSDREFVLEHQFHAPAAEVFASYVDPKLIALWWAPPGGSIRVDAMEVRPGGRWRFTQRSAEGQEMIFSGTYLEVKPVTRLVYTFRMEGQPGSEFTATVDLREANGTTMLILTNRCASKEVCDAMVQYGAAAGAKVAWERLSRLLGTAGSARDGEVRSAGT